MSKKLAIFVMLAALSLWAAAQTQSRTETRDEAKSGIHDSVDIVGTPDVQVHGSSATLTWQTNHTAATRVRYGTNPNDMDQHAYEPGGATSHSVQLTNLQPDKTYYYVIENREGKVRFNGQFSTSGMSASSAMSPALPQGDRDHDRGADDRGKVRITREPEAQNITATTATVAWATSAPGSSIVLYGTNPNDLDGRAESKWGVGGDNHTVELKNLKPNTTYYFRVETGQAQGTGSSTEGGVHSFRTKAK